ncbi:MAG: trp RNA-binding attenuation protein MtrB, partial [Firmicutes bacterium]|nr:trp RNA-binding attenuation protein MtrB [Bacillota bacterium]
MGQGWEQSDYVIIKALENGVTIIGLTRGKDTKFHHSEKLDKGEVMIAQFTEHTSAIKVRGRAEILTRHGRLRTDEGDSCQRAGAEDRAASRRQGSRPDEL